MEGGRQASCPNCGGPIEFKLGSSRAQVCPWCRFTVLRKGMELSALGKIADLVPTAAVMAVGDIGAISGQEFVVGGRLQLDHGKGPWDEWYVEFTMTRQWGWLAKAQGKWYVTYPVEAHGLPPYAQLGPGTQGHLPGGGDVMWTVNEQGQSRLVSAEGELPYPAVAGEQGWYVDISGPGGRFGTVDYGDGTEPPKLFVGHELPADAITWKESAGPRPTEKVKAGKLSCPTCGAPIELAAPDSAERAACASCHSLLDYSQGSLAMVAQLSQPQIQPQIPLGTRGHLQGLDVMCIGFMERCTEVDGITYAWREYLLHSAQGYRWLLEDNGHWLFIEPINPGDVQVGGNGCAYQGKQFKLFGSTGTWVHFVIGEFYWKVEQGERAHASDYIAPPNIVSEERNAREVVWSHGTYVEAKDVWAGFGLPGDPPRSHGVAPAQPNRIGIWTEVGLFGLGTLALLAVFAIMTARAGPQATLVDGPLSLPSAPDAAMAARAETTGATSATTPAAATPAQQVTVTPAFTLPRNASGVELTLETDLGHGWVGVACALVHQQTGQMTEFTIEQDRFHEPGAATSATPQRSYATVGGLAPGQYVLRLDPRWARKATSPGATTIPTAKLTVKSASGAGASSACCCCGVFFLLLPLIIAFMRRRGFESRRWQNSNL